jgi:hypothetical protein
MFTGAGMTDERHLSIYCGRDQIGTLVHRGNHVDTFDASGVYLGAFKKIKSAADAVSLSRFVSCVPDACARMDNSE